MKSNTYSLLNTPWMIDDASATSLLPNLLSLIKGNHLPDVVATKLPVVYFDCEDDSEDINEVEEVVVTSQYIAVLPIKGTVFKQDQQCGPIGTQSMIEYLNDWKIDESIVGVILNIDSGGGQVSGTREFREVIKNFPKPIVTYSNGMIGSAAYWIASASNGGIILNENADLVGSIGAMLKYVNLDGILTAQGAIIEDVYATGSPRKNEEVRAMDEKNNPALFIKNMLDPLRDLFVEDVKSSRPQLPEVVFEGAVYFPKQALDMNLVDSLGTMKDAFEKVIALAKTPKPKNNSNTNLNMNTKQLPNVQAVLGLDAPLASTEENGSYLNFEQLDTIEARLVELEASNTTLQEAIDASVLDTSIQDQLVVAQGSVSGMEASIDTLLVSAGLPVEGTIEEKTIALNAKVLEMGSKDGAAHTAPKLDNEFSGSGNVIGGIDVTAALNN